MQITFVLIKHYKCKLWLRTQYITNVNTWNYSIKIDLIFFYICLIIIL
jgi:hypothetical protein